ncbi:lytic transglycosylase domain-containing protein [Myceligenerans pegani]|uniref:lytic transglycosylase domain-containing protein n=1 Tax=Myceligenerans pegani TaxID=2776917 RepID=UPI001CF07B77|nr:lytic murein transglycosylase [Myceligenerans sp. TRM 65318]
MSEHTGSVRPGRNLGGRTASAGVERRCRPAVPEHRRRVITARVRTWAVVAAAVLLLTGCGTGGGTWSPARELSYPPAPRQPVPAPAAEHAGDTGSVPIADLAQRGWLRDVSRRTEIPVRVLAAYAGASLRLAELEPGCGIGWNTLAGVGAVESVHGSYGGARAGTDGTVSPPIVGIPLDGSEGVAEIVDTDGGELDGDAEWDRAVGPMQFIPATWESWAQDGNLDGRADPHQIDDAALTAGLYLCRSGGDVTTDDGWEAALATYNRSVSYAHEVTDFAETYGA